MPEGADRIVVTKSDLAPLGTYLSQMQAWMIAAAGCLGVVE